MKLELSWHLLVIVVALLLAGCLYHKSTTANTPWELQNAQMYRNYSYVLLAVAVVVGVYYYYLHGNKASMRGYMCGGTHRAPMCGGRMY